MRNAFWVAAICIFAAYMFFLVLGAFGFSEVLPVSIVALVLAGLFAAHLWLESRKEDDLRDPRLVHARERRGF